MACTLIERMARNMTEGILFYNAGTKCLPRLLVAVHSLRKHFNGNICIISCGEQGREICQKICDEYQCIFKEITSDISEMRHYYFFEKARMHLYTPFEVSLFVDSDTVTIKDPSDIFHVINEHDFVAVEFSNWTTQTARIIKRLNKWRNVDNELVEKTIAKKSPSVNVGVYGFRKDSEFMKNWFDFTIRVPDAVLPEESSCHLLLRRYKGFVADRKYNCSCKFDDPTIEDTRIIHYHGRKHCRKDKETGEIKYNARYWIENWKEIVEKNNILWCDGLSDKYLKKVVL